MEINFNTDIEKLNFLLEADADLHVGLLAAEGKVELTTEELSPEKRPKYITNFIGSKQKLIDWIWSSTPEAVKSVFDAFSGSSVVGYMYKTKGLQVFSNDRLSYSYHAARAIVENNNVRLTEQEIEKLLKQTNSNAKDFIQKNFHGIFFKNEVLALLDVLRANIDALSGTKMSMALFALGKTCMSGGGFGHFSSTTKGGQRHYSVQSFIDHYRDNLHRINALVFDNGKENKAFNGDITEIAPKVKADLAYFDPPYATQFSSTNYEMNYHFVEGLMTYWKNKDIDSSKKIRNYKIDDPGVTPKTAKQFFTDFLTASKNISHWLISYRDNAYPTESEIKRIVADLGKGSRMKSKDHKYQLAGKNRQDGPSNAKERLFVCADTDADEPELSATANMEQIAELSQDTDFDIDVLSAIAGKTDNVLVTGYIGNKHFVMNWIDKNFPKNAKSLFDAFSGGANVAYFFKRKGLKITTNDIMRYPYHIARAVIENNTETISDEELEAILKKNPAAGTFIADTFYGYYYTKPILQLMDNMWANIQNLKGYKKDIALAALGHTCKAKAVFGMFNRSKKNSTRNISELAEGYRKSSIGNIPVSEFIIAFKKYVRQLNRLVYDNGQENKVYNDDILKVIPQVKADVIYCDPPYITEFLKNDYEDYYHFVEGLMSYWKDKEILNTPRRNYASRTKYDKESMRSLLSDMVTTASKTFPHNAPHPKEKEVCSDMDNLKVDVSSPEFMEAMGRLMREALDSQEGMRALAAAIAAPIKQEIKRKEISSLLLTKHNLPKGERPVYQKKPRVKAFWISKEGEAREQEIGKDEVEFPTNRIHSAPMVDISVLKHGNIGTLMDIQTSSSDEIRKETDKRTLTVISSAVPAENIVTVSGGVLLEDALNDAISILEDQELAVKYIVLRGRRFNDMRSWDLDPSGEEQEMLLLRAHIFVCMLMRSITANNFSFTSGDKKVDKTKQPQFWADLQGDLEKDYKGRVKQQNPESPALDDDDGIMTAPNVKPVVCEQGIEEDSNAALE